jgi:glucose/arabinose dehydrogenase
VVTGRLSRLAPGPDGAVVETPIITDWCQQYPSHSIGSLAFGPDGFLYASAGDGASFEFSDYGQGGSPPNPCGDPDREGGALRSQDVRTAGDPLTLDGTILRIDPATGAGAPGNPLASSGDANAARVIGHGARNPFRFTLRPGTSEVWFGDVGWGTYEEVNRLAEPGGAAPDNFGWPCYEGTGRQGGYDSADLPICEALYAEDRAGYQAVAPYLQYRHGEVAADETCARFSGSSIAGLAFYPGGTYPDSYDGALFFADYSRKCVWSMRAGADGLPDPATVAPFIEGASNPVNLVAGPGGDLYYPDLQGGRIVRVAYEPGNRPPAARIDATPTEGAAPLTVTLDGSGSTDPDAGDVLAHAWDLDGDGGYDDATGPTATTTYTTAGDVTAGLRVTDPFGAVDTATVVISVDNTSPTVTITAPAPTTTWAVGDTITFAGEATDAQDGTLPGTALDWAVILHHCETGGGCHEHPVTTYTDVAGGSFAAPDHEHPSYLEIRATATDSGGRTDTASVEIQPRTVDLTVATDPPGLEVAVNGDVAPTPLTRTVIVGSTSSLSAVTPQTAGGTTYQFVGWSDGGGQSRNVVATGTAATYTARYEPKATTWAPQARVNFQPWWSWESLPAGYEADIGAVYGDRGDGRTFGWNRDLIWDTRERFSSRSPDQRYDTLIHLQKGQPAGVWELAVPAGRYRVRVVCGDAAYTDSVYKVAAEGAMTCDGTPTSAARWVEGTAEVDVTDGRLTIAGAPGAANNRIAFLEVDRAE